MPRTATAAGARPAGDAAMARVDTLIRHGRRQGELSLPELRAAFKEAGISAADGRGILRELADAGVRLGSEETETPARKSGRTAKDTMTVTTTEPVGEAEVLDDLDVAAEQAEAAALAGVRTGSPEADLDDQTSAMGDSVHTYLKSIGRTSLLTAEQEVDLAKRIEAGLYAEHKPESEPDLPEAYRADLGLVAEDGRRATPASRPL